LRERITTTTQDVRNAYFDLIGAIEGNKVAVESLRLAQESLRNNQTKVEVGTLAPIDIIEAEAEVASNEEAVINAEARIKTVEDRLRALVLNPTQPDFWQVRLEPTDAPSLTPVAIDVEAAIANALANRTDIARLKKQNDTVDVNVRYAEQAGADPATVALDLAGDVYEPQVKASFMTGVRSGVNGTPTFFINGARFEGDWTRVESFAAALEEVPT
jgi:outer membrane protein TolC